MGSIQMYLEPDDPNIILEWLNSDPEIAFFKSKGPKKWIAVETINKLSNRNLLWHTPYKNLPLVKDYPNEPDLIKDPWSGWEELRKNNGDLPYFGDTPGIIGLNINVNRFYINEQNKPVDVMLISSFSWIGNYYRVLGSPALKETETWWKNLRKKIKKVSQEITINKNYVIYAFPNAVKAIENNKEILNQPWPCTPKITYEK